MNKIKDQLGMVLWTIIVLTPVLIIALYITPKKTKPFEGCPQQTQQIRILKEKIEQDSIHIEMIEYNYDLIFEENQIFGSMLAEKEHNEE